MSNRGLSLRLDPARPVDAEVRRVLTGLLDRAASGLRREPTPSVVEVADAEDALAEVRALLRLVRGGVVPATRRSAVKRVRAAQKAVRVDRERPIVDTFELAAALAADTITTVALHRLRVSLAEAGAERATLVAHAMAQERPEPRSHAPGGASARRSTWHVVADDLDASVLAVSLWSMSIDGFAALAPGLAREYERGRAVLADLDADPSLALTRSVAARVRDHQRHLGFLRQTWPEVMKPLVREARSLADLVERQHAFGLLRGALEAQDGPQLRRDARALLGVLEEDRADLAVQIERLAGRVYAEDAASLVTRVSAWWSAAAR